MKMNRMIFLVTVILSLSVIAYGQEEEMTKEEWQSEMDNLVVQKAALNEEIISLKSQIEELTKTKNELQSYDDCMDNVYKMLGATKADVNNFRTKLNTLSSSIDAKQAPKADKQAELDVMKKNKISALPEFFDIVHDQLQRKLDAWEEKVAEINYTVQRGDCLWNIAKKDEHYSNPFAWPIIYNANRDKINEPDLIYPKQVFLVPNLNEEEKEKYDKIRRNYKPASPTQTQNSIAP